MRKRTKQAAIGTVIAAGIGYAVGVLTAPKSGKETRKELQTAAQKAKTNAEKQLKKLHGELSDIIESVQKKSIGLKTKATSEARHALVAAKKAKAKTREVLSALHEGETTNEDLQAAISETKSAIKYIKKYVGGGQKNKTT
ncbi:MAG: YtxH domain-containing protein [Patescibacteria group bacterium]